MKILICDKTENEYIEQMRAAGLTVDVRDDITPEELFTVLPAYDGMVVRSRTKVRQPLIDACPNLKVIVRGGAGLDTIDHEYAKSKGITVMNTPLANGLSVAELALGYMFMLARSLYKATATMKAEKWEKKSFNGDELGGKTLGIIGYGNIGHAIARLALALDMNVVAYDPYVTSQNGAKMVTLDELLVLSGAGYVRHAWWHNQHYRRQPRSPDQDPRPARGRGRGLVFRLGGRQLLGGVRVRRQHEADVGRLRPAARLDGSRAGRKP